LIDPFSKEIGLRSPKIKDDLVLITHDHYDHSNTDNMEGEVFLVNTPGEYERKGIHVRGILSYHDNQEGVERGLNTIFVIKTEEMNVCHLGDLGQDKLNEKQLDEIGDVDILMIPVGGKFTVDPKIAMQIIESIEPKIVIPMHYKSEKMIPAYDELSTLQGFLAEAGTEATTEKNLIIKAKSDLPPETKIIPLSF